MGCTLICPQPLLTDKGLIDVNDDKNKKTNIKLIYDIFFKYDFIIELNGIKLNNSCFYHKRKHGLLGIIKLLLERFEVTNFNIFNITYKNEVLTFVDITGQNKITTLKYINFFGPIIYNITMTRLIIRILQYKIIESFNPGESNISLFYKIDPDIINLQKNHPKDKTIYKKSIDSIIECYDYYCNDINKIMESYNLCYK